MTTARDKTREELLTSGLADWVHLAEIHHQVNQDNQGFTVEQVQTETLDTIRALVTDGLFEVGDLGGPDGRFAAWDTPLEESIKRISEAYIDHFDNETKWIWVFWLGLTDKGRQIAETIRQQPRDTNHT
jgi:hypothetical protein